MGQYWNGDRDIRHSPELARYTRKGELVWRQTGMLGLDIDATDRVLLATQTGRRSSPQLRIERHSPDLKSAESFIVADEHLQALASSSSGFGEFNGVDGLRAMHTGDIYLWTNERLLRIALP